MVDAFHTHIQNRLMKPLPSALSGAGKRLGQEKRLRW
jgi:hypothetical protein